MNARNAYIVFTDLKGFSKLSEAEIKVFYNDVLLDLSKEIIHLKKDAIVWNTWGDALVAIFEGEEQVIELVFKYRDFFKNYNFKDKNIKELHPRIACHFGRFDIYKDPLLDGKINALGKNINTSARIEPITRPNEIYVTKEFKEQIEISPTIDDIDVGFDELGEIPLAKNFGSFNLYRLRRKNDSKKIIDRILEQDLFKMLPEAEKISDDDSKNITHFLASPSTEILLKNINLDKLLSDELSNENYLLKIANICKNFGLFDEALLIIEKLKRQTRDVDGVDIILFKYKKELMKLETNCLTRLGRYEEASNLIYGVFQLENKDSDTLSMLAAQYKRRALFDKNNKLVEYDNINTELLKRSLSLYIEAFRLNIEDYYPVINIAYLYRIMGGVEKGKGVKLADYIKSTWAWSKGSDWWIDTTLLECEIVMEDFENLDREFELLIEKHNPNYFEKKSTYTQLEIYSKIMGSNEILNNILNLLKGNK